MKKLIVFIFINLLFIQAVVFPSVLNQEKYINLKLNPENTVFAFDLHDVLLKKQILSISSKFLRAFFKGFVWYTINPLFWYKIFELQKKNVIWEDFFENLVLYFPKMSTFRQDFYDISNSQEPILPMIELLKKIRLKGYKVFLLSDIGEKTLDDLKKKKPEIFSLFDGWYVPVAKNGYIHKPMTKFYFGFKKYLSDLGLQDKQIIFIDDLEENIVGAYKADIYGIHFTSYEKLKSVLSNLKIW